VLTEQLLSRSESCPRPFTEPRQQQVAPASGLSSPFLPRIRFLGSVGTYPGRKPSPLVWELQGTLGEGRVRGWHSCSITALSPGAPVQTNPAAGSFPAALEKLQEENW